MVRWFKSVGIPFRGGIAFPEDAETWALKAPSLSTAPLALGFRLHINL